MTETTDSNDVLLEATDVERDYGNVSIIDGVSLDLYSGTVTALIGPNGSGKTTLIRTLAGLDEPTAGDVAYRGPERVRSIGYLPQRPAFRPGQTVRDTLAFYATLVGAPEAHAMAHLDRVGLTDAAERDVDALSGGMTRLVGIAQAMIGDPPVIVLDEPASGLDPSMRVHIFDVAERLADSGTAVLLSSHDLALVERTADRVVLFDEGDIVHDGSPAALCDAADAPSLLAAFESSIAADAGTVRVQGETA